MKQSNDTLPSPLADEGAAREAPSPPAYRGAKRGFGGGRYAAPYSGSYGGEFRDDYRAARSHDSRRFPDIKGDRPDDSLPDAPST